MNYGRTVSFVPSAVRDALAILHERFAFPRRRVVEAALAHVSGDEVERAFARGDLFRGGERLIGVNWIEITDAGGRRWPKST